MDPKESGFRQPVECRRCGCTTWNWWFHTHIELNTNRGTAKEAEISSRDFRCASCGGKATKDEVSRIQDTRAYSKAVLLKIHRSAPEVSPVD